MLKHITLVIMMVTSALAGQENDPVSTHRKCAILPEAIGSNGNLTCEEADKLNLLLADAGYCTGSSKESSRFGRGTHVPLDLNLQEFEEDLEALGEEKMVEQGRLVYADLEEDTVVSQTDAGLQKRNHCNYHVSYMDSNNPKWTTSTQTDGHCVGRFSSHGNLANYVSWSVSGKSCKFTLYKDERCRGHVSFDTGGFNVVSDGSRYDSGFRSIFFKCR